MSGRVRAFAVILVVVFGFVSVQAQETKEVRKSGSLSADGRVHIDTYKGSITVTTWDKAEIDIYAKIEPDGYDRYSEEKVQDTEIQIDLRTSEARIKTDYERAQRHDRGFWGLFGGNSGSLPFVHYTIKMPRTARLVIKDYKSNTSVSDLRSDAEVETYKGRVEMRNLDGSLLLETYKGEVWADFANLARGSRFDTYKGEIEITLPGGEAFDVDADLGRRADFDSDFDLKERYRSSRRRDYDIRASINGGGPVLRLKTDKCRIRLRER